MCTLKSHNIISLLRMTFSKEEAKTIENTYTFKKSKKISQTLKINTLALDMHTCDLNILYLQRSLKPSCPCTYGNKYR